MRVVCVRVGELAGKTRDGAASVQVYVSACVCLRCWDQIKSEIVFEMKHLFCGYKLFLRWSDLISCSTPLGSAESSSQTRDRLSIKHPPRLRWLRWHGQPRRFRSNRGSRGHRPLGWVGLERSLPSTGGSNFVQLLSLTCSCFEKASFVSSDQTQMLNHYQRIMPLRNFTLNSHYSFIKR